MHLRPAAFFVHRPVATTLLAMAVALFGILALRALPVSSLPEIDFPTIAVTAVLPGATPATVASAVALPLERQFTAIAGITEMSSTSYTGSVRIVLQFDLDRDIDGAARDVQAAINAARAYLPDDMNGNPTYRKVNPSDAPVMVLALTSADASSAQMYDIASTRLQQKLLQTEGVGDVLIGGGALPAVRVELDPLKLDYHGISLEQVRATLARANANRPKGQVELERGTYTIRANDSVDGAAAYAPLVVRSANGAVAQLSQLGKVYDGLENIRNFGLVNGQPAVALVISKRPGANVVETVDRIRASLPQLTASMPAGMHLSIVLDRTQTIRASLREVERTLLISVLLVVLVTWAFFRDWRSTLLPAIAVPLSLLGTFGVMWALGYSLNILSLMALTIATGFVVDDAIVVVENIMRHLASGGKRLDAVLAGTHEVGFTVFSISLSLVAVFIPLLAMPGLAGRLLREFSVTLSVAVLVSMLVSLIITPGMARVMLRRAPARADTAPEHGWYARSLRVALQHPRLMLGLTAITMVWSAGLLIAMPKGFFPQQDTGLVFGQVLAPQNISFGDMRERFTRVLGRLRADPDIENVFGFVGGSGVNANNTGAIYATLKPLGQPRTQDASTIITRLNHQLAESSEVKVTLQAVQDIAAGSQQTAGQYQYTLTAESVATLDLWAPRVEAALRQLPMLSAVISDKQDQSLSVSVDVDRSAAARLGVRMEDIDQTLYDAFGQRHVSTTYRPMNQYHVVMNVAPAFWQDPDALHGLYVPAAEANPDRLVPLDAIARFKLAPAPISLAHRGQFPSVTLSFNLQPDVAIGSAMEAITQALADLHLPASVTADFSGSAKASAETSRRMPALVLAALLTVYIVLGILYESLLHPLTILSTLPSAGLGALLALSLTGAEFSVIAMVGIILLIGIVKKNAIMLIDFALTLERAQGLSAHDAIYEACLTRFRPIMMTTLAALFGALPLLLGHGYGSEFRHPLGSSIIGGLLLSQLLTLYSTPAIYLCVDALRRRHEPTP